MSANPVHPSLGTLYADHHGWLRGLLNKKLGCRHKAEDLAQDTFVKLLSSELAAAIREPRALLTTVANALVVSHWRRQDLERAYLDALQATPPAWARSPEDKALALEALAQVDARLRGLPPNACRAFLMARLEGLSYPEIAAELGVSERMVKKYMAQVMHRLLLQDD
ncbi:sigma-70 family RNA polymerase sigma factor [Piscinibacter sp.]|uniref:sigma-70 family RNA polymerase sigma factor n=1 Tax=Piscinibacter sp. TaxID=1903157 RepID=UPI0039E6CDE6